MGTALVHQKGRQIAGVPGMSRVIGVIMTACLLRRLQILHVGS